MTDQPPAAPIGADAVAAARGGTALLVLQTAGRLAGLVFIVVATRHLSPGEFGRYSAAAAVVVFANFLADLGTTPAITRLVTRSPAGEAGALLSGTLGFSLVLGMVAYANAVGFAYVAYSGPRVGDVLLAGLAIPASAVLSSVLGALDGSGLIARRAVVTVVQTAVSAFGVVPLILGAGVRVPILTLAAAPYVALALAATMARRGGIWHWQVGFDRSRVRLLVRAAFPFALSQGLTAVAMRFDVILISVLKSSADTATYDLALRIIEASAYMATAVCGPLLFILSRRLGEGDVEGARRAYREASRVLYMLGLPLSVALLILARPVVEVVFGPGFEPVATPLAIMGAGQWLTYVVFMEGALVMGGDHIMRGVALAVGNTVVLVLLDIVLVPAHGVAGAAAAMLAAWAFAAATQHEFHRRTSGIATPLPPLRLLGAVAVLAVVLVALRHGPLLVSAGAGAAAYGLALWATRAITADDLRRLRRVLLGPPDAGRLAPER